MSVSFSTYKADLVRKLYNRRLINKTDVKEIVGSRTRYGLAKRISDCYTEKLEKNYDNALDTTILRGFVLPCEIPLIKFLQTQIENFSIKFAKILSKKDTNPEVLKIKKDIRKDFGIKNLYLDNNLPFSKKIQKALKILKENNVPLANEIIVNSILDSSMGITNPDKRTILLSPRGISDIFSTNSPLHLIIHEGIHLGQPDNPVIQLQKMPDKFKETINNLSLYASDNFILEVHAELKAKQLLRPKKFTKEEGEALFYIENLFKEQSQPSGLSFLL